MNYTFKPGKLYWYTDSFEYDGWTPWREIPKNEMGGNTKYILQKLPFMYVGKILTGYQNSYIFYVFLYQNTFVYEDDEIFLRNINEINSR